jgi:hypothetical protein
MSNPWKLATIGIALTGVTAVSTGVTTAYLMRPATSSDAIAAPAPMTAAVAPPRTSTAAARRPAQVVRATSASTAVTPAVTTATAPAVITAASAPIPTECGTGGERAMKIAKPGLIGTLAGAGLGAIGGAIADGGSGAGKGAIIGGLAGAAVGGGYGAYKTQQECGTIFGNAAPGLVGTPTVASAPAGAPHAALHERRTDGITVYNAR